VTLLLLSLLAADPPAPVGRQVTDFTLPDAATGTPWVLADQARTAPATVVAFLSVGCPVSNGNLPTLAKLAKKWAGRGVMVVGVNSHPAEDAAAVAAHAKENGLPFPVLKDDGTAVADRFAVDRLPTVFVLDAGRKVRYAGRVDDQFAVGVHKAKAGTRELADAVEAVLDGKEVPTAFAAPAGCKLTRPKAEPAAGPVVTYHREVSRIVQAKCQGCHRPGEPAPFQLMSYKQAKGWAGMIREVVEGGVMPPWHADAPAGHFRNDRRLSDDEKRTLLAWVDQGCPEGDPADAPPAKAYATGWRLGREPDVVLEMSKPVGVPGSYLMGLAGMPYQYVEAGGPFAEDTWVQACEVRPDLRGAIHHIIAFLIPPGQSFWDVAGPNFGRYVFAAYVPGDEPSVYPEGLAKLIPKGGKLLFEVHYTPNGKPGTDRSKIGLIKATAPPKYEAKSDAVFTEKFRIPPHDPAHTVVARRKFKEDAVIAALTPHMHLRGKAFRYDLTRPDGTTQVLLNVPRYDFNWQVAYHLTEPARVPAGSTLTCTAVFDNSAGNPANPDPSKPVRWGEQTWEEMMIGFIEVVRERK
jgi:peroxiredoxin